MIIKVDIGHHSVGFLDHQPVSAAGGGEVGVDAAGAGGLVAVADET